MSSDKDKAVDFVLVRTMTDRELVDLLLSRFPAARDLVCLNDDYCLDLACVVYDSFAQMVLKRADDPDFIQSVVLFIDELSARKEPLIYEVLITCLLEGIAQNEQVARMISRSISPQSRSLLHEVESNVYGRAPSES